MRKKVRKSLAFLLALALVVSVMSGLGLSVSADDAQNESVVTETEGEPAEEKPKAEESTSEKEEKDAEPAAESVQKETKDEKKTAGEEGSEKAAENKAAETPKAGENVQTATIGTGDKTVTVKTTAAAGVLPEGAKLVVKKLANQDQAYQDAESTLRDSQVPYDDFLALDVGFEVNGKEVEPEAGSVQVQFELGAGLLPETANLDSLSVQHLTDGKAETVTNEVAVTESGVKADFTVSSFSTFTITWWGDGDYNKYYEFTVHYVDEKGNEINPSASNIELSFEKTINFFNEYSNSIEGYQWLNAYYGSYAQNGTNQAITTMEASGERIWHEGGFFSSGYYEYLRYDIKFKNGDTVVQSFRQKQSEKPTAQTGDIYLVFQKNTTGDTGGTIGDITLPAPGHTKKAVRKDDGTYDLSLDVSGSIGSEAKKIPLDVVMIIDRSGSMNDNERIKKVKTAANKLIDGLSNNNNLDVNYNIVTFSSLSTTAGEYSVSEDDAATYGWTESADVAKGNINGITATGGTNYQAGIRLAKKQLNLARSGVQTAVIFFTDGIPTFRLSNPYDEYGQGSVYYGNGQDDSGSRNINAAVDEIKGMYTNRFYAIGTSGANEDNLNSLSNGVNASDKKVYAIDDKDIGTTFDAIEKEINKLTCTNVSITDTLNENAQIVKTADGKTPLTITVTDKSGNTYTENGNNEVTLTLPPTKQNGGAEKDRTLTATYVENEENGRQIKLIFPKTYSLEADYTYTVTTPIEPTEKAYENYRNQKETYLDTPDAGTGTHAEKSENGFYCNDTAQLKYNNTKGDKTVDYDKPVIRLPPGNLVIKKTIAGELTEAQVKALEENLTFKYTLNKGEEQSTKLTDWTKNDDGTYTASATVASGLSPNTEYTVTEANETVKGYVVNEEADGNSGTIGKGDTKTASFTNTYTKATQDLTITKVIQNLSPDAKLELDTSKEYTFTVTADEGVDVAGKTYTIEGSNKAVPFTGQEATVTIQGEGSIKIKDLPVGGYTVTEQKHEDVTGYDFVEATYSPANRKTTLTSSAPGQVTVTNKYKIKQVSVTVKKVLAGNMYDSKDTFDFTVDGQDGATLGHNKEKKYTVDYGSTFTVTEKANSKGYTLKDIEVTGSAGTRSGNSYTINGVTEDTKITFTNDKTIQPPNGIITTIAPYAIMVVLAAGAGVYFVYSRRRRNH